MAVARNPENGLCIWLAVLHCKKQTLRIKNPPASRVTAVGAAGEIIEHLFYPASTRRWRQFVDHAIAVLATLLSRAVQIARGVPHQVDLARYSAVGTREIVYYPLFPPIAGTFQLKYSALVMRSPMKGWSSAVGFQVQIDIGSTVLPVTINEYLDLADFSAL